MSILGRTAKVAFSAHMRWSSRVAGMWSTRVARNWSLRWSAPVASTRGYSTTPADRVMSDQPAVVYSPHPDVNIPDNISLPHYIFDKLAQHGDRTALVNGETGQETSFSELSTQIKRVSSAFVRSGLRKGDVVTLFSPNCPEFAVTYLAVAAAGGIVSAVNPVYTSGELQHAVAHAGGRFLVTSPSLLGVAKAAAGNCPSLSGIIVFGNAEGCRPFSDLLEDDGGAFPENMDFKPKEDMVALPYSSGTTGLPKGVMLSHYNIIANLEQIRTQAVLGFLPEDVLIGVLPFFHIYGLIVVLMSSLVAGSKLTVLPGFNAEQYLSTVQTHGATFLHVVPPMALFLAQHPLVDKYDLRSVKTFFVGAAPVSNNVIEQVVNRMKQSTKFRQGYGMTEASPVTHCNPPVDYKYASVGPPVHNTESKVVDVTTGETLGYGHEGEVLVRGPQVMLGYFKNEKATAGTITEDGWLRTGDIGYCQPDCHFYITDRLKELIKVKGFQVAPAELEALLLQNTAVLDAAVIGVPDERAGELPRAYVVLKPDASATEDDIKDFIKDQVAPFKQLAGGVEFIAQVPKSASGKILRRELKSAFLAK